MLTIILSKVGLEPKVSKFFANYLVQRKTNYAWNNMQSPDFKVNIGVGQESVLSPILSALYLTLFLHILEKCSKDLKIPFLCFLLLMMDLSLLKTVPFLF